MRTSVSSLTSVHWTSSSYAPMTSFPKHAQKPPAFFFLRGNASTKNWCRLYVDNTEDPWWRNTKRRWRTGFSPGPGLNMTKYVFKNLPTIHVTTFSSIKHRKKKTSSPKGVYFRDFGFSVTFPHMVSPFFLMMQINTGTPCPILSSP